MDNIATTEYLQRPVKKRHSLSVTLVTAFLCIALIPLILVSWYSYSQAEKNLILAAKQNLEQSAFLSVDFIKNWFDYRLMDLNTQAESYDNTNMLIKLRNGFLNSDKTLEKYVKSYDWVKRVDSAHSNLVTISRQYDYIFDLYLIDNDGNILYSVSDKSDLGSNILKNNNSKFAKAVATTKRTGMVSFSGLERYQPSQNNIVGFITAPLLDEFGENVGTFAIQLSFERIFRLLNSSTINSSLIHYLVSKNGKLLTPYRSKTWTDVLIRKIELGHLQPYNRTAGQAKNNISISATQYLGPNNQKVIGVHHPLALANIDWILVSEIDAEQALASAEWLEKMVFILVILTIIPVSLIAIYLARNITQPIIALANVSMKVATGESYQAVSISTQNEIGQLAAAFDHMLVMRRRHERALEKSTAQSLQALEELAEQKFALDQHSIVSITDVEGLITVVNNKFSDISGYSKHELIGFNHRTLNSGFHETAFFHGMYRTISGGKVWHAEVCNKNKQGDIYWVDTTIVPFTDASKKPKSYISIQSDITKRKQAEQSLRDAKNIAENAVRAKSSFLASMSHEIRTPMNGVLGMLGLLQKSKLDEQQSYRLDIAKRSAESLLLLINDILDFSKIEANKLELEILNFDLPKMLGEFVESMGFQAQNKGLELVLDVSEMDFSMAQGDPGRLRQILTNIVSNAIKFTKTGEIVIRAKLTEDTHGKLSFDCSISDTGIGIPAKSLDSLFSSFTQVDASTTRQYGGTGLGLAIVKKLCLLMHGDVSVSSVENEGSRFHFSAILSRSVDSGSSLPLHENVGMTILVVDDNDASRSVLCAQLKQWGVHVVEANSGDSALRVCRQRIHNEQTIFDLALIDMQMPEMTGVELCTSMNSIQALIHMKRVLMTPIGHPGGDDYCEEISVSANFSKPITLLDLQSIVNIITVEKSTLNNTVSPTDDNSTNKLLSNHSSVSDMVWPEQTRILLVEDNQVNQLVVKGILDQFELQIDVAANGIEALSCLNQAIGDAPYTLVLMDCQMPEMDGYETTRQIRDAKAGESNKSIAIIAMTANTMQGDRDICLQAGMDDYISKPVESESMIRKIFEWLPKTEQLGAIDLETKNVKNFRLSNELKHIEKYSLLDEWDRTAALHRLMDNESLLTLLTNLFSEDTPKNLDDLQAAIANADFTDIRNIAHSIKGIAANLSGLQVAELSAAIENSAKNEKINDVSHIYPLLVEASKKLTDRFSESKSMLSTNRNR